MSAIPMRTTPFAAIFVGCCCLLTVATARAETIRDQELGFSLKLSSDFIPRPDIVEANSHIPHAFQFGEPEEGEIVVLLMIEKLGGTIGRERAKMEDIPPDFQGDIFVAEWQGFELDGFEVPESVEGVEAVTYNVQIPLRGQAIQIKLFGTAEDASSLKRLLREILSDLEGESNWLSSSAPSSIANSEHYGVIILCVAIVGMLAVLVGLWFLSRRAPKGTVLAIAIVIYFGSWQNNDSATREMRLLTGSMRMMGIAAGILGIIDVCRKRKPKTDDGDGDQPVKAELK